MGPKVASPTHVSMSQHGGKVPTLDPQETMKIWLIIITVGSLLCYAKIFMGLVLRVGSRFLLDPTLNTNPKALPSKVLSCRQLWHTQDLGLGTTCEVISPNYHALNG